MSILSKETIETAHGNESPVSRTNPSAQPLGGHLQSDAVSLEVPLKVHGSKTSEGAHGAAGQTEAFEEQTGSMIVFPHGGVVRMSTPLSAGQMLVLTNLKTRQDAICRVVRVRNYSNSASYVEVEFTHRQPGFWGVYFEGEAPAPAPDSVAPAVSAPLATNSAKPRPMTPSAPASAGNGSNFISLGSQEPVQPAASLAGAATPAASTSGRPALGPTVAAKSTAPAVLPGRPSQTAAPSSSTGANARKAGALSSGSAAANAIENLPTLGRMGSPSASDSLTRVKLAGETLSSRLGSDSVAEDHSAVKKNWLLMAACGAALLLVAGGGFLFFSHKPASNPPATSQPVATQPPTMPSGAAVVSSLPVTANPAASKPNAAPAARETTPAPAAKPAKEAPVVRESYASSEPPALPEPAPAPAPAPPAAKTSVPSVFGTLNTHPVAPTRTVTAAAPNVDAPSIPANALAGITSPPASANSLPAPVVNPNLPVPVGGRISEPQLITRVLPQYPPLARQAHTQGDVVVQIVVDKSGNVADQKVISGPVVLRQAAVDAVRRWKYAPPALDGQPITVQMLVTLRFQL